MKYTNKLNKVLEKCKKKYKDNVEEMKKIKKKERKPHIRCSHESMNLIDSPTT